MPKFSALRPSSGEQKNIYLFIYMFVCMRVEREREREKGWGSLQYCPYFTVVVKDTLGKRSKMAFRTMRLCCRNEQRLNETNPQPYLWPTDKKPFGLLCCWIGCMTERKRLCRKEKGSNLARSEILVSPAVLFPLLRSALEQAGEEFLGTVVLQWLLMMVMMMTNRNINMSNNNNQSSNNSSSSTCNNKNHYHLHNNNNDDGDVDNIIIITMIIIMMMVRIVIQK